MVWTFAALATADDGNKDLTAAAAKLNAQTAAQTVDVPISAVAGYMLTRGIIAAADAYASNASPAPQVVGVIRALEGMMASPHLTVVEMSDPTVNGIVVQMLGALTAAGIMTAEQQTEVLAMGTASVPVWQPAVTAGDIQTSRAQK